MEKQAENKVEDLSAGKTVSAKYADVTLRLLEEHGDKVGPLTPEIEKKLRRKLYLRLIVLVSAINIVLFVRSNWLLEGLAQLITYIL